VVDVETGHRVDVDVSPKEIEAFTRRRVARRAALERHVLRNNGRWLAVDAADALIETVVPRLMAMGIAR